MAECHIYDKSTMPCSIRRRCVVYMAFSHEVLTPGLLSEDRESLGIEELLHGVHNGLDGLFFSIFVRFLCSHSVLCLRINARAM